MDALLHAPDTAHLHHLDEARRVLALPAEASGLHWHPFGVYGIPLAKRTVDDRSYSRRLHIWHPDATPVGESSLYGVHTHSGTAHSHVLVGALQHHLYAFRPDPQGLWIQSNKQGRTLSTLIGHLQGPTLAGTTHTLPPHTPHGVSKPPGFAISLFEQQDEGWTQPFTTWQRTDIPEEPLLGQGPVPVRVVLREARQVIEEALFAVTRRV